MDWLFVCLAIVPMIMCPRFLFNGFALPQTLAVALLSAASLVAGARGGVFSLSAPVYLVLIFAAYSFLAALRTKPVHNAKKELGLQVPFLVLFLVLVPYAGKVSTMAFAVSTSVVCFLICIYAVGQTYGYDPFFPNRIKRGGPVRNAIGTIGNPNFLSSYLCASFWMTVYAGAECHWAFYASSFAVLYAMYKTRSRAGQVSLIGSVVFFILFCAGRGWLPRSDDVFVFGVAAVGLTVFSVLAFLKIHWETFWRSEIDPDAERRVWFASFRYRLCYWLVALHLIKKKWLLGWGLQSYRREVYEGQAEMNELYPGFMDRKRYITPQPRECHNDWIEHVFEYGVLGAGIFFSFLYLVFRDGFSISSDSLPNLFVLTGLVAIVVDATFFFALRIPSTALYFWVFCAFLVGASGDGEVISFDVPWHVVLGLTVLGIVFLWECVIKRAMTSRYFMRSMGAKDGMSKYWYLCRAMVLSPEDTTLRTHATIMPADDNPTVATIHAMKALEHFDGQITHWSVYYNFVLAWLKGYRDFFDTMTFYAKRGHYLLNYFKPLNMLLNGRGSISLKSKHKEGAMMRVMDETSQWKVRSFVTAMESAGKDCVILQKEMERLQLALKNAQQQAEISRANLENVVLYEKKRMNIPDSWIYDSEEGVFKNPDGLDEAERKKYKMEG